MKRFIVNNSRYVIKLIALFTFKMITILKDDQSIH